MRQKFLGYFLILSSIALTEGCVERLEIEQIGVSKLPIVIEGFISNQTGPYVVKIKQSFTVGTSSSYEAPVSVKKLTVSDNVGNEEDFQEVKTGVYQTSANGIQGVVNRVYKLRVELLNGKVYESTPDTLRAYGTMDSVYANLRTFSELNGTKKHFIDIYFDAHSEYSGSYYFIWKFKGTFKVVTSAELDKNEEPCGDIDCTGCSICNRVQKCSGIRNFGTPRDPIFRRVGPCLCCTCWYNIFNDSPILSDYQLVQSGKFIRIRAGVIPIDDWILQHKIYADVNQFSVTRQAYLFYKAIKDQQEGSTSLFQPASGRIPENFNQTIGIKEPVLGLFYAASVQTKTIVLTKRDVPQDTYAFPKEDARAPSNCLHLYPNSTTERPTFWVD
jgi:hypothetical protein